MMNLKQGIVNAVPGRILLRLARPYVSGHGYHSAIEVAQENFEKYGLYSSIDMLGESVETEEDAFYYKEQYLSLIHDLQKKGMNHSTVSLKPSSMGLSLCSNRFDKAKAKETCYRNIEAIVRFAQGDGRPGIGATIDMEQSDTVDDTLDIYRSLRKDFDNIGTVLQSCLYRTEEDIQNLADVLGRIRICIGVYKEPPEIAQQDKKSKKRALISHAMEMLELGYYVEIATHDTIVLDEIIIRATENEIPFRNFEFQWLLGVPVNKRKTNFYRENGIRRRLYIPFYDSPRNAVRYLRRRMIENPHSIIYVSKNMLSFNSFNV